MARSDSAPATPAAKAGTAHVAGQVRSGLTWSLVNNVVLRLASLTSGIVLARILSPEDFGVYAIALTVLVLLLSANELGVSLALVQRPGNVADIAPTVMTISLISSVAMYGATYALAPVLADLVGAPDATGVIRVMALAVLPDGAVMVPWALLNRNFMQARLFAGEAVAFAVNTGLTIPLAIGGFGAYSFAWGAVAGGTAGAVVHTCLSPVRVGPGWDSAAARSLLRFGLPLAGASLLVLAVGNVDNLVVGAVLGQTLLGYYLLAYRQSNWPLALFSEAARRVALAGFSRLSDDREVLSRAFARGLGLLMAATVPAGVLLAGYAEPVIRVIYGDRWAPAAQALPLLALFGLLRIGLFVAYDLLVALGRTALLAVLQFVWLAALVPALMVGARLDGIRGAAAAHLIVAGGVVVPLFLVVLWRLGVAPGRAVAMCWRPLLGGIALALVAWAVAGWVEGDLARLALGCASVLVVYLPVVWPMRSLLPTARRSPDDSSGDDPAVAAPR